MFHVLVHALERRNYLTNNFIPGPVYFGCCWKGINVFMFNYYALSINKNTARKQDLLHKYDL